MANGRGQPTKLKPELIDIAAEAAAAGGALSTIAAACGVHTDTVENWLKAHREGRGTELHEAFFTAIKKGQHQAELRAVRKICEFADSRDAQWWLTHNPRTRETWSDAAADRRAERKTMASVIEAIAATAMPPDLERTLLLNLQARGLGVTAGKA